jgi:RNA polymerase sigma factor (sigma-70 family)
MRNEDQSLTPVQSHLIERELLPHLDAMYNFAMHLTRYNENESNDLVQDAFLKACRAVSQYREGTNAKAWLFTILKNAFINSYREKMRTPDVEDIEKVFFTGNAEEKEGPQKVVDLREEYFDRLLGDEITAALNSLSPDFRTIILLCDVEEFTYEEIASIIGVPIGTVRSRIHRARNHLKEKLQVYAREQGYQDKRTKP